MHKRLFFFYTVQECAGARAFERLPPSRCAPPPRFALAAAADAAAAAAAAAAAKLPPTSRYRTATTINVTLLRCCHRH
jgi:hypothetical protein